MLLCRKQVSHSYVIHSNQKNIENYICKTKVKNNLNFATSR